MLFEFKQREIGTFENFIADFDLSRDYYNSKNENMVRN